MSRLVCALLAGAILLAAPGAGAGQSPGVPDRDSLIRRLDSLTVTLAAAREAADQARARRLREEAEARHAVTDTVFVGPLRIITPSGQGETAREIFEEAWRDYDALIAESPALDSTWFVFQWPAASDPVFVPAGEKVRDLSYRIVTTPGRVKETVRTNIGAVLATDLAGTTLAEWFNQPVVLPRKLDMVYRTLATSATSSVRSCAAGTLVACRSILGLGLDDDPSDEWYTAEERQEFVTDYVERMSEAGRIQAVEPDVLSCATGATPMRVIASSTGGRDRESVRPCAVPPTAATSSCGSPWSAVDAKGGSASARRRR